MGCLNRYTLSESTAGGQGVSSSQRHLGRCLEKSELIARRPNPKDRRSTHIVLVQETAEKVAPLFTSLREAQDKIVSRYSEQELELLSDFFTRSVTMWEEEREKLLKQKEGKT